MLSEIAYIMTTCQFTVHPISISLKSEHAAERGSHLNNIRNICSCNEYHPLKPHFYIEKMGFAGVCIFSYFFFQNIDSGSPLEPPNLEPR